MEQVLNLIGLGIIAFISTNIDDFFIATTFFTEDRYSAKEIVVGKYLGIIVLIAISCAGYFFKLVIPIQWIGLMGMLPVIIGIRHLVSHVKSKEIDKKAEAYDEVPVESPLINTMQLNEELVKTKKSIRSSGVILVALVTFSSGGDNIGVYMPLFASLSLYELVFIVSIFLVMVGIWCAMAYFFVNNKHIGLTIKNYGEKCFPFILILLGIYIFVKCKTFAFILY